MLDSKTVMENTGTPIFLMILKSRITFLTPAVQLLHKFSGGKGKVKWKKAKETTKNKKIVIKKK